MFAALFCPYFTFCDPSGWGSTQTGVSIAVQFCRGNLANTEIRARFVGTLFRRSGLYLLFYCCGGLLVDPVPSELGVLGDAPMLPESPLLALPPQLSEIMVTLATLKVFSGDGPDAVETPVPALPLSHVPFSDTSCPTWADRSWPVKAIALPFLLSNTYCPPCDCTQPRNFLSALSVDAVSGLVAWLAGLVAGAGCCSLGWVALGVAPEVPWLGSVPVWAMAAAMESASVTMMDTANFFITFSYAPKVERSLGS